MANKITPILYTAHVDNAIFKTDLVKKLKNNLLVEVCFNAETKMVRKLCVYYNLHKR